MQSLCTLRHHCRQWPRNTHYQAGATPYLGRTSTGWIAPACGWRTHSITSSAATSRPGGTGRPSAFAVLRLTIVSNLVAAQDAVDIGRRLPIHVDVVGPVRHETTGGDEQTLPVDRRQTVPGRERNDEIAVDLRTDIRRQEQAAVRCPRKRPDGALNVRGVLDQAGHNLDPERRRQGFRCTQEVIIKGRGLGVDHESGALKTRRDLLEHRKPLAAYARLEQHQAGDITARPRQARDES